VFLGQPMMNSEFDMDAINLDLSVPPPAPAPDAAAEPERDARWEEVNTKLDLAKAYEEMGDLEGARELLQEVLGEGSADLVAQAQEILGRIGG
ncbi:MAG TPA: FimV/HubP family polar landmark protein, partial [Azonexus sp.]|nr:FimV/HubP family polar landmark protein [Azonexus sp.]